MQYIIENQFLKKYSRYDTQFSVQEGATVIGEETFLSSYNLIQINIQEGETEIKDCAFEGCSSLTNQPTLAHQSNNFSSMKTGNHHDFYNQR